MRSNCAVYVDAGYLLAAAATRLTGTSLRSGIEVQHSKIVTELAQCAERASGLPLLRVHWYDSARNGVPDASHERIALLPKVKVRLGRIGYDGEQKGVDLRIGLDMVAHARNGAVDAIFLVSGDDDLTEAVEEAQAQGVEVTVVAVPTGQGRPHGVSRHLQQAADGLQLIDAAVLNAAVSHRVVPEPADEPSGQDDGAAVPAAGAVPVAAVPGAAVPVPPTAAVPAAVPPTVAPPATPATKIPVPAPPSPGAVPSPALFAPRPPVPRPDPDLVPPAAVRAVPAAPPAREPDLVYSGATGRAAMLGSDYRSAEEIDEIVAEVIDRVQTSWLATASADAERDLRSGRPYIPREIDRALLLDASDRLGVYDLSDAVRHQLRSEFWTRLDGTPAR